MKRVFGIGSVVVDHVVRLPRFPEQDTKVPVIDSFQQIGGPVPVALSAAAHYGTPASFFSRWGNDTAGQLITDGLKERGVNFQTAEVRDDWSTGFAHVWTEAELGTRTIAYSRGEIPLPTADHAVLKSDAFLQADILHLDGWAGDLAVPAAQAVSQRGGLVMLDAGSVKPRHQDLLPHVDILVASLLFCRSRFGRDNVTDEELRGLGPKRIVVTRGARPIRFLTPDSVIELPTLPVQAVDSNGAGDIFCGALLAELADGKSVEDSLPFATSVAAISCESAGNFTWAQREDDAVRKG